MSVPGRDYDIVLHGASGFTGRQTVGYFAAHVPPGSVRWAIGGRNRARLEAVRRGVGAPLSAADVVVADSADQPSVDAMVSRTRIMLSTAGPFALYGTPIADACVRFEAAAARLVTKYGAQAEVVRELAYRLYTLCERKKRAQEATSYYDLVQSWPEIMRLAPADTTPTAEQGGLFGET